MKVTINGLLLLDKPQGLTSNQALQKAKHIYRAKKAGHTGSLDPLATGMLPICFGAATKFSQFLLESDKTYRVIATLGVKTASGDQDSPILSEHPIPALNRSLLEKTLTQFRGAITQIPSMYSALKYQGQPLYKLARQGIEIARNPRNIMIYKLILDRFTATTVTLTVSCSKGTYIRTLVDDIGDALGCGAHVTQLRRIAVGPYVEANMVTLEQLYHWCDKEQYAMMENYLHPIESMFDHWQAVRVDANMLFYLARGQVVLVPHAPPRGWVKLMSKKGDFLGVGEVIADGHIVARRLL